MTNLKMKSFLLGLMIILMGVILFMPSCQPPEDLTKCELTVEEDAVCVGFAIPFKFCTDIPNLTSIEWFVASGGGDLIILNQDNPVVTVENGQNCETVLIAAASNIKQYQSIFQVVLPSVQVS